VAVFRLVAFPVFTIKNHETDIIGLSGCPRATKLKQLHLENFAKEYQSLLPQLVNDTAWSVLVAVLIILVRLSVSSWPDGCGWLSSVNANIAVRMRHCRSWNQKSTVLA
jgi:hypothetical protein